MTKREIIREALSTLALIAATVAASLAVLAFVAVL